MLKDSDTQLRNFCPSMEWEKPSRGKTRAKIAYAYIALKVGRITSKNLINNQYI